MTHRNDARTVPAAEPDASASGQDAVAVHRGALPAARTTGVPAGDVRLPIERWLVCDVAALREPMAVALAGDLVAGRLRPWARLIECRRSDAHDIVVLEVEVEVGQVRVHDIRFTELLAVVFTVDTADAPEVLALRDDFPRDVPHRNLRSWDYPISLCLYDVPFRDIRPHWTPARYVEQLREWLRLTARGELHADDQILEPLLSHAAGWVILPAAVRELVPAADGERASMNVGLAFEGRPEYLGRPVLVGVFAGGPRNHEDATAVGAIMRLMPRVHGCIRRAPSTVAELHAMLQVDGDDLLGALRTAFVTWESREKSKQLTARFVLILIAPKRRRVDGPIEATEIITFCTDRTVGQCGEDIGAWQLLDGVPGKLIAVPPDADGRLVEVAMAYTFVAPTRADLARYSGRPDPVERCFCGIGSGALGSQIIMNAARGAHGRWTVIDSDILLPHNFARHALPLSALAYQKATATAVVANRLAEGPSAHEGIVADVLASGAEAAQVHDALRRADVIVDMSASVTVARMLARDMDSSARRVSIFLSPSGADLVALAEDSSRSTTLDGIEMQLYRAVSTNDQLKDLLVGSAARVRYGRSCRDVSIRLPQTFVGIHAGVGALALEQIDAHPDARLLVWRIQPDTLGVTPLSVSVEAQHECSTNGWRVVTDTGLLRRLQEMRAAKLPNETGGVLLGTYDLLRRIAYVVDTIPSPDDSHEYPRSYLRGCAGLPTAVDRVSEITAGQLHYVGEWHSHPVGHPCLPSGDDRSLFKWLVSEMERDGLPALMFIVGDSGLAVPYIEAITDGTEYPAELRLTSVR